MYPKLAVVLVILCASLSMVALTVGRTQSHPRMLAAFTEGCEGHFQECIYGIVPGITIISEARKRLETIGYNLRREGLVLSDRVFPYCSDTLKPGCINLLFGRQGTISAILLWYMDIRVGDLLVLMGPPDYRLSRGLSGESWSYQNLLIEFGPGWPHSPFETAPHIQITLALPYNAVSKPWRGFLSRWRYCQFEPEYPGCKL